MKKALTIIFLLILSVSFVSETQAQSRKIIYLQNYDNAPYHFGFLLGVNYMTYNVTLQENYQSIERPATEIPQNNRPGEPQDHTYRIVSVEPISSYKNIGFSVGVIGDKRLGTYLNLRVIPTLSFGPHRNIIYRYRLDEDERIYEIESLDINSDFFEFPIHLKYRSKRYNNIAAYLLAGVNPKFYLSRKKNQMNESNEPALLQTSRGDIAVEVGTGFDIYNQWFKMGIEIKMSFGMLNVLKTDATSMSSMYNAPFEKVKNKQLQVSLTFE